MAALAQVGHAGVREIILRWEADRLVGVIDRSWPGVSTSSPRAAAAAKSAGQEKEYGEAYNYLLRHSREMQSSAYRRVRLPIGSGVTEAGCKVVFTQRFKESGMTWGNEGGEAVPRLAGLSGVWDRASRDYLDHRPLVPLATPLALSPRSDGKVA